jgi:LmbE family N-acetylglucosaminyl deacetylase
MTNLFISPHNDDETLFGAVTLMREKPLVVIVTDSWIQFTRGDEITADQRWEETKKAMEILGCPVLRLGIRDDCLDEITLKDKLSRFVGFEKVYAPAEHVGGNLQHNLIGKVAGEVFGDKCKRYTSYASPALYIQGTEEVKPTPEEVILKDKALACYESQIKINGPHFDAVKGGKSEWFI